MAQTEDKEQGNSTNVEMPTIVDTSTAEVKPGEIQEVDDANTDYDGNKVEFLKVANADETQEENQDSAQEKHNEEKSEKGQEKVLKKDDKPSEDQEEDYKAKYEELKAKFEQSSSDESQPATQAEFASDYVKRLNALVKEKGEDVLNDPNFNFYQNFDAEKVDMNDTQTVLGLLKRQMSIEYPELSREEVEQEIEEKYEPLLNKDEYTSDDAEYRKSLRSLKIEGAKAKNFLAQKSNDYKLPNVEDIQDGFTKPKLTPEQQQAIEKAEETYKNGVETFTSKVKDNGILLDVKDITKGEIENISFKPSEQAVEMTKQYMLEGRNDAFFNRFVQKDESGKAISVDADSMAEAITWGIDKQKIVKTLIDQGISIGKSQADKEYNNTSFDSSTSGGNVSRPGKPNEAEVIGSIAAQIRSQQREDRDRNPWDNY